jgi:sporulation protein YtfJ
MSEQHPIEVLMETAMNNIKDMVDVNTIIGDPIETTTGMVIIPISKVSFGFAAGGSEFKGETLDEYKRKDKEEEVQYRLPFGGGSGAGISINPVAFVLVQKDSIKVMPIEHSSAIDKLMDYVPDIMDKANKVAEKQSEEMKKDVNKNNKIKDRKIKIHDGKMKSENDGENVMDTEDYFDNEEE